MKENLTPRQRSVFEYIDQYQKQYGIAPSVRDICAHFNLKSPGGIHRILNVLIDKGYLSNPSGKKRAWSTLNKTHSVNHASIPLLGKISAGLPISAVENRDGELPVSGDIFACDDCFGLRVQGDSMIDVHIMEGDIAIIRQQEVVDNYQIAAVLIDDSEPLATLKIFIKKENCIELRAANKSYKPLIYCGKAQKRVKVIGRYIGIIRGAA